MKYALLMTLAVSAASFAEDPFSCVDPDVADAFLGHPYYGKAEYSTSIPDGFARLNVPASSSLVGSQTTDSLTTVVYKTSMSAERALDMAIDALSESGWTENPDRHRTTPAGFQASVRPISTALCHADESGALSVLARDHAGRTFVSYVHHSGSPSCKAEDAAHSGLHHDLPEMMRLVPTLKLPDGVKASNVGMGGGGDTAASHVDISGGTGRPELQNFFEAQIRNQNWEFQTGWSSHISSGSVWSLKSAEHGILIGTLHLFDSGVDPVRVRFSISPANPTGTDYGSWSSS